MNVHFRLIGVPPELAVKTLKIDPNSTVDQIKILVKRTYLLDPILKIDLVLRGEVLGDTMKGTQLNIDLEKDQIVIMIYEEGG